MERHFDLLAVSAVLIVAASTGGRPNTAGFGEADGGGSYRSVEAVIDRGGITASKAVHAVLDRAREALGGPARLSAVRSLRIDWTLTFEGQRPNVRQWRFLLPNRFSEIRPQLLYVIDGANYYQDPEPAKEVKEEARRSLTTTFVEQSLVLLVRAPSLERLRATLKDAPTSTVRHVVITRPDKSFLGIDFDATTYRPIAYYRLSGVSINGKMTTGIRRVMIDEMRQISGIWFPTAMTIQQEGFPTPVKMAFTSVRVNEGVTRDDFRRR